MDVYLIRHADAVQLEPDSSMDDFDRPLTDLGRTQCDRLAKALPSRGVYIQRLFYSPLLRARQTAEPLIAAWGLNGDTAIESDELAPDGKRRKLARQMTKSGAAVVGLVGHSPDLNRFAAWLIGGKRAQVGLQKAGVALIRVEAEQVDKGAGELIWLLPADWV